MDLSRINRLSFYLFVLIPASCLALVVMPLFVRPARRTGCGPSVSGNLRQIGLGLLAYMNGQGKLPSGVGSDALGRPMHGWQAQILPYIDNPELANAIDYMVPWNYPQNSLVYSAHIRAFRNPDLPFDDKSSGYAPSHFAGNSLVFAGGTAWGANDFTDGIATTFLAGQAGGRYRAWGDPANVRTAMDGINKTPSGFGSQTSPNGANFLFADGSVRFVGNTVAPKVFRALATPDAGD